MLCKLHIHIIALFGGLKRKGRGVEIGTPTPFLSLALATDKPVQRGRPQNANGNSRTLFHSQGALRHTYAICMQINLHKY